VTLSLADIAAQIDTSRRPPVERWTPPDCGDMPMRIRRDGVWLYQDSPIRRPELVRLFASVLRREPDGRFVLVTPVEKLGITVEDAPFLAVELVSEGEGRARNMALRLSIDEMLMLDSMHPLVLRAGEDGQQRPYVLVRPGLEALVSRALYYEMVQLADAEHLPGAPLGLWSHGCFFSLGEVA
jgi:uncharacterized protein